LENESTEKGNLVDLKILRRLFVFAQPYLKQFWLLVTLTLLIAVLGPLRPKLVQLTIDQELAVGDYPGVVNMILLLVGLLALQSIVQYFHTYLAGWLGQYIIRDIRTRLYRHIQGLKLTFYDNTPIGRLVTRNVSDIQTLAEVFTQGIAAMIGDILMLIVILAMMFSESWKLALVSLALLPILLMATYVFKEKIKVAFNDVRNAVSNLNTFVQEHITGMNIVQIFNAEAREYRKFEDINRQHRKANMKSVLYFSIYFPVAEIIQAGAIGLILWYGAGGVLREEFGIGVLIAFIMYIQMFFRPIRMIADRFNTLQMGVVSTKRILKLLDSKEHISDSGDYHTDVIKGSVEFEHVRF
jgi:ATP-binding cassette subfamily B protein